MPSNPTIVLVTGAFHVDSAMDLLGAQLAQAGFNTRSMGLVTVNRRDLTAKDDASALLSELLNPLVVEEGKDIVLYLHSYAGFPGSAAIAGLSKQERSAKGQKGGVIGLIYQSAFCPIPGKTLIDMIGGSYAPWQVPNNDTGLVAVVNPKQTFYADVKEPLATAASNQIYGQSIASFNSPSGPVYYSEKYYDHRRVYIHTKDDQALPPFAQDLFVTNSGVQWDVKKIGTSHSPFLSEPGRVASMVVDITRQFAATF